MLLAQYTTINASVPLTATGVAPSLAQGFKIKRDATFKRIYLYLTRTGNPGGSLWVYIKADDAGPGSDIVNGISAAVIVSTVSESGEWVAFDFDADSLPHLEQDAVRYITLVRSSQYTPSASAYISWGADQTSPHYLDGVGHSYGTEGWEVISPATDFAFKVLTGTRLYTYPAVRTVESMSAQMTSAEDERRFNHSTLPSIEAVLSYEESVSNMIDAWLAGASVNTPLTTDAQIALVQPYANYCMALECELTHRTSGFYTEEGDTRASALRKLCGELRDDIKNGGVIISAIKDEQSLSPASGSAALSAGHIESTERDDNIADTDLIQPIFRAGMWDNQ